MSDESFVQYLQKIGLLNGDLNRSKNIVFALSDYLRSLTPSEAYDVSLRMMKNFSKQNNQQVQVSGSDPWRMVSLIMKLKQKQSVQEAFSELKLLQRQHSTQQKSLLYYNFDANFSSPKLTSQSQVINSGEKRRTTMKDQLQTEYKSIQSQLYSNQITQQEAQVMLSRVTLKEQTKGCTFKPQVSSKSPKQRTTDFGTSLSSSDIHDRLYEDGINKVQTRDRLKQLRAELEMVECTFKPQVSTHASEHMIVKKNSSDQIFERLHRTQLVAKQDWSELQMQQQMKGCTFAPSLSSQANLSADQDTSTFVRLHREADTRSKCQEINELVKQNLQLKDCTFKPRINSQGRRHSSQVGEAQDAMIKEEVYQRLHRENEMKQRKLMMKQEELMNRSDQKMQNTKKKPYHQSQPAHERLYQRFEQSRQRSKDTIQMEPLSEKRQNQQPRENGLLERMKDFAEKKKRNLIVIESTMRVEQGVTFNPKINKSRNIPRSRSTSTQRVNSATRNRSGCLSGKPNKSPALSSLIKKDYDSAAYCETAFFNLHDNSGTKPQHKNSFRQQPNIGIFDQRQSSSGLFSLEANLLQQLDTDTREKYMNLQIGT